MQVPGWSEDVSDYLLLVGAWLIVAGSIVAVIGAGFIVLGVIRNIFT